MPAKRRGLHPFLLYLISLVIGTVLLSAIYLPIIIGQLNEMNEPQSQSSAPAVWRPERPSATLLMIGQLSESSAELFMLVRLDSVNQRIVLMGLPLETRSTKDSRTDTLAGFFRYAGPIEATLATQGLLGITIDRYLCLSSEPLKTLCDGIGAFDHPLDEEIAYRDERTGYSIELAAGTQQFDGAKMLTVITANRLNGTGLRGVSLETELFAQMLRQNLSKGLMERADSLFTTTINAANADLSMADYVDTKAFLQYLAEIPAEVKVVAAAGTYSDDGGEFYLSENSLLDVLRYYS